MSASKPLFIENTPVLEEFSAGAVIAFSRAFEVYAARAGKAARPMVELVSPDVACRLLMQDPKLKLSSLSGEAFLELCAAMLGPATSDMALDGLERVKMEG